MKTTIILCLVFWMSTAQAQKTIALDPATVNYSSPAVLVTANGNNVNLEISEEYFNQFFDNPIKFVEENFDFHSLQLQDFEEAQVRFVTTKGYLNATYDKGGDLVKTSQKFKNIYLPRNIWEQVYKENTGWTMLNNKYTASGKGNKIDKAVYQIKLSDGKKTKNIKISPAVVSEGRMVNNVKIKK